METEEDKLETFFAAARAAPPVLSDAAVQRIVADAENARIAPRDTTRAPVRRASWLPWLTDIGSALGGWRAAGGIALAGLAGLWIGWADTAGLGAALLGTGEDASSLVPDEVSVLIEAGAAT